nr:tegument protein pp71 [Mastomys natalensis cytomegalovirus 3]WEG69908.1 tegument protein pp71 [Mastomys natalensis cytomegalovirus 3]WEG70048.1 tegument protein pp71 [Mastomys natalensis cytomegalovirus 3]WEG70188.1 tegument protein pp71 [Mastomys natalensis cytomegalovirus 3]WEG70328.1 tegument protein pp71 [Mastomys natalensis cytomegalovirus 3]
MDVPQSVLVDPKKPQSEYAYGITQLATLRIVDGGIFKPRERKILQTGLSVAAQSSSAVCVVQRLFNTQAPSAFAASFYILHHPSEFVNISVPVTNTSRTAKNIGDPDENIMISVCSMFLRKVDVDLNPIITNRENSTQQFRDSIPNNVSERSTSTLTNRVITVTHRTMKWTADTSPGVYTATSLVSLPGDINLDSYNSAKVTTVSNPDVRVDSAVFVSPARGGGSKQIRFFFVYDTAITRSAAPDKLNYEVHLKYLRTHIALRHCPGKYFSEIPGNGFYVHNPQTLTALGGETKTLTIQNTYYNTDRTGLVSGVFFPLNHKYFDVGVCTWTAGKPLNITVTALMDTTLEAGLVLGRIHFFFNHLLKIAPLDQPVLQSDVRLHVPTGNEPYNAPTRPTEEMPSATVPLQFDYNDDATEPMSDLSLNSPSQRHVERAPRRGSADERLFAQLNADNLASENEEEEDEEPEWFYDAVGYPETENQDRIRIANFLPGPFMSSMLGELSGLWFAMVAQQLTQPVSFNKPIIDKIAIQFMAKGTFRNLPLPAPAAANRHRRRQHRPIPARTTPY